MAILEMRVFKLKNGSEEIIRTAEVADAAQMLENGRHFIEDETGQVMIPGELPVD